MQEQKTSNGRVIFDPPLPLPPKKTHNDANHYSTNLKFQRTSTSWGVLDTALYD
jgi:hypothetical protein